MSGLDDVNLRESQLVAVFDDDKAAVDPFAKQRFQRKRHSCRGFTAAGDKYVVNRGEIVGRGAGAEAIVCNVKNFHDGGKWIGGLYTRREYFPGVCAEATQRKHDGKSNNSKVTISNINCRHTSAPESAGAIPGWNTQTPKKS